MLQVMPKRNHDATAEECLQEALKSASGMKKVLVIYEMEDGTLSSADNGVTLAESVYLIEIFKHWLLKSALGGK